MKLTESLVLLGLIFSASGRSLDLTQQQDTSGADVVRGVLSKIEASNVFTTSTTSIQRQVTEEFMRETAYVESLDGTDYPLGVRDGGVWRISRDIFQQTKQYNYPSLFAQITEQFCISWTDVEYAELRKPFYSGLAVRIYLFHLYSVNLGLSDTANDTEKATFWINNFGSSSSRLISTWFTRVDELRKIEVCRVTMDVMFVIDSSSSIGNTNYQKVRNYVYNFTQGLLSGGRESRIGIILIATYPSLEIELGLHDSQMLLNSISNLRYLSTRTNTPEALCLLKFRPWRDSLSVLRTAIVLSDGRSNERSTTCLGAGGYEGTVRGTSAEVHRLRPPVLVYAVGVGDYDISELNTIATSREYVSELASFDEERLEQNQRSWTYSICFKDTQSLSIGNLQTGTARNSSVSRHELSAPAEEGMTIRICITEGVIVIYGSYTIPNPSAALYDFSEVLRAEGEAAMNCYASYVNISNIIQSSCNVTRAREQAEDEVTVYITIEGMSEIESSFSITSSLGIAFECARSGADSCGEHAVFRTEGSCVCECAEGYEGDGRDCQNVDECVETPGVCGDNQVCTDTDGSYTCACADGYTWDGQDCQNVDECAEIPGACGDTGVCTDTNGSHVCSCEGGYRWDGQDCQNVNECVETSGVCGDNKVCTDTNGGYICSCESGYKADRQQCQKEGAENSVSLLIILIPLVGVVLLLGVIATIVVCVIVCCVRRNKTYKKFDIPEIKKRYKKSDDTVEADIES